MNKILITLIFGLFLSFQGILLSEDAPTLTIVQEQYIDHVHFFQLSDNSWWQKTYDADEGESISGHEVTIYEYSEGWFAEDQILGNEKEKIFPVLAKQIVRLGFYTVSNWGDLSVRCWIHLENGTGYVGASLTDANTIKELGWASGDYIVVYNSGSFFSYMYNLTRGGEITVSFTGKIPL